MGADGEQTRVGMLCVLFFFSGFPALIHQLTWQRSLFRIFGVNTESVTIVVTAFMLGLGLGSFAGGWIPKKRNVNALILLGAIELITAAFGLISLTVFEQVGQLVWNLPLIAAVSIAAGINVVVGIGAMVVHVMSSEVFDITLRPSQSDLFRGRKH